MGTENADELQTCRRYKQDSGALIENEGTARPGK